MRLLGALGVRIIFLLMMFDFPLSLPNISVHDTPKYRVPGPKLLTVYVMIAKLGHVAIIGRVSLLVIFVAVDPE